MKSFLKLKLRIIEYSKQGILYIFGSSIISQVCSLLSSILVIRNLSKFEYGNYVDANNIYSYFAIFIGLGFASAIIQYGTEYRGDKKEISLYSFVTKYGFVFNLILAIVIIIVSYVLKQAGKEESSYYFRCMSFLPIIVYIYNSLSSILRVRKQNKYFAFAHISYSVFIVIGNLVFTRLWGVIGLIWAQYEAYLLSLLVSMALVYKSNINTKDLFVNKTSLSRTEIKEVTKYSVTCAITNFASTVLVLLDVTCLGIIVKEPEVLADYKVASTIPQALHFIPGSLMTFFYTDLVLAHKTSNDVFKKEIERIWKAHFLLCVICFLSLFCLARPIVFIIYGEKYMNIIPLFRVLSINFLVFSCGRHVFGNVVASTRRVEINLYFSILSGIINIILNIILISQWGAFGAAIATLSVTLFIGVLYILYMKKTIWDNPVRLNEASKI